MRHDFGQISKELDNAYEQTRHGVLGIPAPIACWRFAVEEQRHEKS